MFWDDQSPLWDDYQSSDDLPKFKELQGMGFKDVTSFFAPEPPPEGYHGRFEFLTVEDFKFLIACGINPVGEDVR